MTTPNASTLANAIRFLAIDAVQKAKSGHPGAPMGMAEMATALWRDHLVHNPTDPHWVNRDRFVLSNGHASMLLYALLHLTGYDLSLEELKNFRQMGSKTPGHPEVGVTPGVETTTGPLGQGISNAVGMALAEKLLAAEFNKPEQTIVNHYTYVFMGDGCLMEGISHEVCELAAAWRLNKLIALYDSNGISIDGKIAPWFTENVAQRFTAYGWNVIYVTEGHDVAAISQAISKVKLCENQPSIIICDTHIGYGSPNRAGTSKAHGEPLGNEEIALTRQALSWEHEPFVIPENVIQAWDARAAGQAAQQQWQQDFSAYAIHYPEQAADFMRRMQGDLPLDFEKRVEAFILDVQAKAPTVATRKASQMVLEALTPGMPELLGGSADLTGSNLTNISSQAALRVNEHGQVVKSTEGKNGYHINYGVREFGMAAILNGVTLHGGFIPYAGTFVTFSDYSRNAIRMAALMKQRVIHVLTHDSIGLGEDGPTHQPVEHAASLRLIPGLDVWRPADVEESAIAWQEALKNQHRPSVLLFSRQGLPFLPKMESNFITHGAYVLAEPSEVGLRKKAQAVIMATGSEVQLAMHAQALLAQRGVAVRVVSMPSTTVFDRQKQSYQLAVLPPELPRIAVEAGVSGFWWKYGCAAVVGIDTFGESAPADELFKHFGFTPENVADTVCAVLLGRR